MSFSFLRKLSGNEVKIFMIILTDSDERHEFGVIEKLVDFDISPPTVYKVVDRLVKIGLVKKFDQGNIVVLRVGQEYHELAMHIKKGPKDLVLFEEIDKKTKQWWKHKDCQDIIDHYCRERFKITDRNLMNKWWTATGAEQLLAQAKRLLTFCKDMQEAQAIITNCRIKRDRDKIPWTLGGDILNNILDYTPKTGGIQKWS